MQSVRGIRIIIRDRGNGCDSYCDGLRAQVGLMYGCWLIMVRIIVTGMVIVIVSPSLKLQSLIVLLTITVLLTDHTLTLTASLNVVMRRARSVIMYPSRAFHHLRSWSRFPNPKPCYRVHLNPKLCQGTQSQTAPPRAKYTTVNHS